MNREICSINGCFHDIPVLYTQWQIERVLYGLDYEAIRGILIVLLYNCTQAISEYPEYRTTNGRKHAFRPMYTSEPAICSNTATETQAVAVA